MKRSYEAVLIITAAILVGVGVFAYCTNRDNSGWWAVSGCVLVGILHLRNLADKTASPPASIATIAMGAGMLLAGISAYFNERDFNWGWPIMGIAMMVVGAITAPEHDEGHE